MTEMDGKAQSPYFGAVPSPPTRQRLFHPEEEVARPRLFVHRHKQDAREAHLCDHTRGNHRMICQHNERAEPRGRDYRFAVGVWSYQWTCTRVGKRASTNGETQQARSTWDRVI